MPWCIGCQRGQKPNEYGVCPDCRMRLGSGEVEMPPLDKQEPQVVDMDAVRRKITKKAPPKVIKPMEDGESYTSAHITTETLHETKTETVQPVETPPPEAPKRKKGKRVMSAETKEKIAASMKAKKIKDVSGNV